MVRLKNGFLTGPVDLRDIDTAINAPHVYVGEDEEYFFLVYQVMFYSA